MKNLTKVLSALCCTLFCLVPAVEAQFLPVKPSATVPDSVLRVYKIGISDFEQGKKKWDEMPFLIQIAKRLGDEEVELKIASDYINNYLLKLPNDKLFDVDTLSFIATYIRNSKERAFRFFLSNVKQIDHRFGDSRGTELIRYIISKEEIDPSIISCTKTGQTPDWRNLTYTIRKKYGKANAVRTILDGQIRWYRYKKNWDVLAMHMFEKIDKYGIDTSGFIAQYQLNGFFWDTFTNVTDKVLLTRAAHYMHQMIGAGKDKPSWMLDTYANLLYKTGNYDAAILWEQQAITAERLDANRSNRKPSTEFDTTLDKMKNKERTW